LDDPGPLRAKGAAGAAPRRPDDVVDDLHSAMGRRPREHRSRVFGDLRLWRPGRSVSSRDGDERRGVARPDGCEAPQVTDDATACMYPTCQPRSATVSWLM